MAPRDVNQPEDDPINDKPMPLLEHLIELRRRLMWSIGAFLIAFFVCYHFSGRIYLFLAEPLAELFDEVVAGTMHEEDGTLTGFLGAPPLVDEARGAWLAQYAERGGYDLTGSYAYGDSVADLPWMSLVGNPTAVRPDARLARAALRRRWPRAATMRMPFVCWRRCSGPWAGMRTGSGRASR